MEYPAVTVDGIVVKDGSVLLIKRGKEPYKGSHALPGGYVEFGERLEDAVVREVLEETKVKTHVKDLMGVYGRPDRDPRGHTISFVYVLSVDDGLGPGSPAPVGGDDAADAAFFPLASLPMLAFDHDEIIGDFKKRLRSSAWK
jgi:8-oxo-dGTP diphosphatase